MLTYTCTPSWQRGSCVFNLFLCLFCCFMYFIWSLERLKLWIYTCLYHYEIQLIPVAVSGESCSVVVIVPVVKSKVIMGTCQQKALSPVLKCSALAVISEMRHSSIVIPSLFLGIFIVYTISLQNLCWCFWAVSGCWCTCGQHLPTGVSRGQHLALLCWCICRSVPLLASQEFSFSRLSKGSWL